MRIGLPSSCEIGAIHARDLGRRFELRDGGPRRLRDVLLRRNMPARRSLWALRHVDLDIKPGETFGVVGQNGSGKSTLLKLLAGVFGSSEGTLAVGGRVGSLLEVGAGFHLEFTGTENVYLNASVFGIPRAYVDQHLEEIIAFAELEEFAHQPVKTYSSGMFMRLGFSVAMHIAPDVLLLDEVLAVGDEAFQHKCFGKIWDYKRSGGTMVFVSHSASAVERLCDRAILLDHGQVQAEGTAQEVLLAYHRALRRHMPGAGGPSVTSAGEVVVELVSAVAGDGSTSDRFLEADPVCFSTILRAAKDGVTRFSITIRNEAGQVVCARTHPAVALPEARPVAVKLHVDPLPVREGTYRVDVRVEAEDGDRVLADCEAALQFGVFPNDPTAEGPVFWHTAWELPAPDQPLPSVAAEQA
jgi:ABC-type polysaccharide/polyol phosphate transport system ATPase subunit